MPQRMGPEQAVPRTRFRGVGCYALLIPAILLVMLVGRAFTFMAQQGHDSLLRACAIAAHPWTIATGLPLVFQCYAAIRSIAAAPPRSRRPLIVTIAALAIACGVVVGHARVWSAAYRESFAHGIRSMHPDIVPG